MTRRLTIVAVLLLSFFTIAEFSKTIVVAAACSVTTINGSGPVSKTFLVQPGGNAGALFDIGQVLTFSGAFNATEGPFPFPAGFSYSNGSGSPTTETLTITGGPWTFTYACATLVVSSGGTGSTGSGTTGGYFGPLYYDGRLNDKDGAETAAVYCMGDGSVRVYALGTPWFISFTASHTEIARVPKKPAVNTLIKQGKGAVLYRLTSGELQVNSPGLDPNHGYYFIFQDCPVPPSPK